MTREELKSQGLTDEQIEFVMAEYKKETQKATADATEAATKAVEEATKPLTDQLKAVKKQVSEYEEKLKTVEGLDEKAQATLTQLKTEYEEKSKEQEKLFKEAQKKATEEVATIRREAETKDFLNSLSTKFITPETQQVFEKKLNDALLSKDNEGKNRADIFASLIKNDKGEDRTDIFIPTNTQQNTEPTNTQNTPQTPIVAGGTNPHPSGITTNSYEELLKAAREKGDLPEALRIKQEAFEKNKIVLI